jgi:hypothetical protein
MSRELERAMKRLKDMGVTVTTTAAPGADSIAGRIQAEADRQGIGRNPEPGDSGDTPEQSLT